MQLQKNLNLNCNKLKCNHLSDHYSQETIYAEMKRKKGEQDKLEKEQAQRRIGQLEQGIKIAQEKFRIKQLGLSRPYFTCKKG